MSGKKYGKKRQFYSLAKEETLGAILVELTYDYASEWDSSRPILEQALLLLIH